MNKAFRWSEGLDVPRRGRSRANGLRRFLPWASLAAWLCVPVAEGVLVGYDHADNEPYDSENTFQSGQNGGYGFAPWVELQVGTPGAIYRSDPSLRETGTTSWELGGTYALGRGLAMGMEEGNWTLVARHGAGIEAFCGFTLRTTTETGSFGAGEIFRFGMNYGEESDATRIYYSTDGGASYGAVDLGDEDLRGSILQYSVTWSTLAGTYVLGVRNLDTEVFGEATGSLAAGDAVAMFGVGAFEATLGGRFTFDGFEASSIPEPGTLALALLGAAFLGVAGRGKGGGFGLGRTGAGAGLGGAGGNHPPADVDFPPVEKFSTGG